MGLILGFSWVITFFVLAFQISFMAVVLLAVSYLILRYGLHQKDKLYFKKISVVVVTLSCFAFVFFYVSYVNFTINAFSPSSQKQEVFMGSYWKENLGQGMIGTISFINPILRPLLYLLPRRAGS